MGPTIRKPGSTRTPFAPNTTHATANCDGECTRCGPSSPEVTRGPPRPPSRGSPGGCVRGGPAQRGPASPSGRRRRTRRCPSVPSHASIRRGSRAIHGLVRRKLAGAEATLSPDLLRNRQNEDKASAAPYPAEGSRPRERRGLLLLPIVSRFSLLGGKPSAEGTRQPSWGGARRVGFQDSHGAGGIDSGGPRENLRPRCRDARGAPSPFPAWRARRPTFAC